MDNSDPQFLFYVGRWTLSVGRWTFDVGRSARQCRVALSTRTEEFMNEHSITAQPVTPLLADNLARNLKVARPDTDESLPHIGLVGDTYTILLSGADTDGRYCLIDSTIPPGGGPPPHRHDFEGILHRLRKARSKPPSAEKNRPCTQVKP